MTSSLNKFELQARDGQCVLLFTKKNKIPSVGGLSKDKVHSERL